MISYFNKKFFSVACAILTFGNIGFQNVAAVKSELWEYNSVNVVGDLEVDGKNIEEQRSTLRLSEDEVKKWVLAFINRLTGFDGGIYKGKKFEFDCFYTGKDIPKGITFSSELVDEAFCISLNSFRGRIYLDFSFFEASENVNGNSCAISFENFILAAREVGCSNPDDLPLRVEKNETGKTTYCDGSEIPQLVGIIGKLIGENLKDDDGKEIADSDLVNCGLTKDKIQVQLEKWLSNFRFANQEKNDFEAKVRKCCDSLLKRAVENLKNENVNQKKTNEISNENQNKEASDKESKSEASESNSKSNIALYIIGSISLVAIIFVVYLSKKKKLK